MNEFRNEIDVNEFNKNSFAIPKDVPKMKHKSNNSDFYMSRLQAIWEENKEEASHWFKYFPPDSKLIKDSYTPQFSDSEIDYCFSDGEEIELLVMVISAPSHAEYRSNIRKTWGSFNGLPFIKIAFFIGYSGDRNVEKSVENENNKFYDIIKINLKENYFNLTLKTVAMLEFVTKKCSKAKFILKIDDDVFCNIQRLLHVLKQLKNKSRKIYGILYRRHGPIRKESDKFYRTLEQYSGQLYPPYVSGPSYLITRDLIQDLYYTALRTPFFPFEDTFLTGFVMQQLGLSPDNLRGLVANGYGRDRWKDLLTINFHRKSDIFHLWEKYKNDDDF